MIRPRPFGALTLLAAMFLTASAIKAVEAGQAHDLALPAEEDAAPEADACAPAVAGDMLEDIDRRARQLAAREEAVARREVEADAIASQAETRLAELRAAEQKLAATIAIADTAAEDDLSRITAIYENMKPEQAAGIFEAMEVEFAAGFLSRMNPAAAAAVLANLPAEFAYAITVVVAGRNARTPS